MCTKGVHIKLIFNLVNKKALLQRVKPTQIARKKPLIPYLAAGQRICPLYGIASQHVRLNFS
jgi:hypothetical protein